MNATFKRITYTEAIDILQKYKVEFEVKPEWGIDIGSEHERYITEVKTWGVNEAKWKAATEYCKDRGWSFHIFTEKELGIK